MTEDEAKTKWCPAARIIGVSHQGLPGVGTSNRPDGDINCIASACMAWRWRVQPGGVVDALYGQSEALGGFCGLAGPLP